MLPVELIVLLKDLLAGLEAVHDGHVQVEDDGVEVGWLGRFIIAALGVR